MGPEVNQARLVCVDRLKVLADDTRFRVIQELVSGPRTVSALGKVLGTEQSLLSHHLRVLRDAGLVVSRRRGKHSFYSLATDVWDAADPGMLKLGCCHINMGTRETWKESIK